MRCEGKTNYNISHHDCSRQSRHEGTPCLKSGLSEPHMQGVEGKQLPHFKSHNFLKLSDIPRRVPDLTIAGMFSGGEAFLEVKLDLCLKVVRCRKSWHGFDMVLKGAWGGVYFQRRFKVIGVIGLMALLIWFQWFQQGSLLHWATCPWSRKSSPHIGHNFEKHLCF